MIPHSKSSGLLDADYAEGRTRRPELVFRYKCRAAAAARAIRDARRGAGSIRVLELGAADGRTLLELRRHLAPGQFVGVEKSRSLIESGPPLPPDTRLVEGDVCALSGELAEAGFDAVVALAVLEHLDEPAEALRQASLALRPGGLMVASCPVPLWDHVATRLGLLEPGHHESHPDAEQLTGLVWQAGLELVCYERFMWAPVGVLPYLRVPVNVTLALAVDRAIGRLRLFDALFVNQLVVARKPYRTGRARPA